MGWHFSLELTTNAHTQFEKAPNERERQALANRPDIVRDDYMAGILFWVNLLLFVFHNVFCSWCFRCWVQVLRFEVVKPWNGSSSRMLWKLGTQVELLEQHLHGNLTPNHKYRTFVHHT